MDGERQHEQTLTLMNLTYDSASASLFNIYTIVYDEIHEMEALQKK